AGSKASTVTSPAERVRKPSRSSTVVVFPAAFGPGKAKISLRETVRSIAATAWTRPYVLHSPGTLMTASVPPSDAGALSSCSARPRRAEDVRRARLSDRRQHGGCGKRPRWALGSCRSGRVGRARREDECAADGDARPLDAWLVTGGLE